MNTRRANPNNGQIPGVLSACLLLLLAACRTAENSDAAALLRDARAPEELGLRVREKDGRKIVQWREMVRPESPVTLPMLEPDSAFDTQASIALALNGGPPLRFTVDTGAPVSLVQARAAVAGGVRLARPEAMAQVFRGVGGGERTWFGVADRLAAGEALQFRKVLVAVRAEEPRGASAAGPRWEANLLGMSTLGNFAWLSLDFPARRVTFSYRDYFTEPPSARGRTPLHLDSLQMRVPLRAAGHELRALVDTGNDAALMLDSNTVRRLGWDALAAAGRREKFIGAGGVFEGAAFTVPSVEMAGITFTNVPVVAGPEEFGVVIGAGLLRGHRVTFDLRRKQMWVE